MERKQKHKREEKQKPFAELINNKATQVETVEINQDSDSEINSLLQRLENKNTVNKINHFYCMRHVIISINKRKGKVQFHLENTK